MRSALSAGRTGIVLLATLLSALLSANARAAALPTPSYRATVVLREPGLAPKPCGSVAVFGNLARLDVFLGEAGMFRALIRPDQNALYLVSENMRAYAAVPVYGDETDLRELGQRVADSLMPFGLPLLSLREDGRQTLGPATWNGYEATKVQGRFVADFMGLSGAISLTAWENAGFAPFPLRLEEIRAPDDPVPTGNSVELADIRPGGLNEEHFALPEGYARHSSAAEMLLYVLSGM
jgi:hypothetical protein